MPPQLVFLGADHAGFALKEKLKRWLNARKIPFQDLGNTIYDKTDDYPDFAIKVAKAVAHPKTVKIRASKINAQSKNTVRGILICGSAQGMCIVANKIKCIRAVVPFSLQEVKLSRRHNDANVLCLSGWFMNEKTAWKMVHIFLTTPFSQATRHRRRIQKIGRLEATKNP